MITINSFLTKSFTSIFFGIYMFFLLFSQCLAETSNFVSSQNEYSEISSDEVSPELARIAALLEATKYGSNPRIIAEEIYYDFFTGEKIYYVMTVEYEKQKENSADKEFATVFVGTDKGITPVPRGSFGYSRSLNSLEKIRRFSEREFPNKQLTMGHVYVLGVFDHLYEFSIDEKIYYFDIFKDKVIEGDSVDIMKMIESEEIQGNSKLQSNKSLLQENISPKWSYIEKLVSASYGDMIPDIGNNEFESTQFDLSQFAEKVTNSYTRVMIDNYDAFQLKWTQEYVTDSLPCSRKNGGEGCCYAASITSILSYWDDFNYNETGPFEQLIPEGDGNNLDAAKNLATEIYNLIGKSNDTRGMTKALKNITKKRGYSFKIDFTLSPDEEDIKNEINSQRPFIMNIVNYTYTGNYENMAGKIKHSVVVVGYGEYSEQPDLFQDDFVYYAYNNWDFNLDWFSFDNPIDPIDKKDKEDKRYMILVVPPDQETVFDAALSSAKRFLGLLDKGKCKKSCEEWVGFTPGSYDDNWIAMCEDLRALTGKTIAREMVLEEYSTNPSIWYYPGYPDGEYVRIWFGTIFKNPEFSEATEIIVMTLANDGKWRVFSHGLMR